MLCKRISPIAVAWACLLASPALAQHSEFKVVTSLGIEATRNPYLESGAANTAGSAVVEVSPQLSYDTEFAEFDLTGFVQSRQYSRAYGNETNYGVSAAISRRETDRLTLRAGIGYRSLQSHGLGTLVSGLADGNGITNQPLVTDLNDVTILGQRGRTAMFSVNGGLSYKINDRDSLSADTNFDALRFSQAGAANYQVARGELSYLHAIDERTSVGVVGGLQNFNYSDPKYRDARTFALMGNVVRQLGERWKAELSAGVGWTVRYASALTPRSTFTTFVARGNLCYLGQHERACFDYSRDPQPTALGAIRSSDRFGMNYSTDLSDRDRLTFGATYSRSAGSFGSPTLALSSVEFVGAHARYQRELSPRMNAYFEVGFDRLYRSDFSVPARATVGAGISYTFGGQQ